MSEKKEMANEEAIAILQEEYDYCKSFYGLAAHPEEDYPEMAKYLQALQIALSALCPITKEQVEKVWRGEWINLPYIELFKNKCSQCGIGSDLESDFCPACGSPMTDKAVDMVMERMEALRNES